jgi:protein tyrosine phosphatase (PTP) superfamily phosphohydrolase (DUF442 family)
MKRRHSAPYPRLVAFALALLFQPALGQDDGGILNYRAYSPSLSSAGQPTVAQLEQAAQNGFERVVYLAYSDHDRALPHQDRIVEDLGMEYVHLPVLWSAPARADFDAFVAVMQSAPEKKTLVHCELNFRASSLTFLYRVLHLDVPLYEALDDLQAIWIPNATWQAYLFAVLEAHGVAPDCDACMWE